MDANFNILDFCNCQKLEVLDVADNSIKVEPRYHKFPFLCSLSLSDVYISASDISLLLRACPKLEVFKLVRPELITLGSDELPLELISDSLKEIVATAVTMDMFTLRANVLEKLVLTESIINVLEIVGIGMLKVLVIENGDIADPNVYGSPVNLEAVDVRRLATNWEKFHQIISRSSRLRMLRLWDVVTSYMDKVVDLKIISSCFPLLNHLSVSYNQADDDALWYEFQSSVVFENVLVLEVKWSGLYLSLEWVSGLVESCPCLEELVIYRFAWKHDLAECQRLADFAGSIVSLMKKYSHVELRFVYK